MAYKLFIISFILCFFVCANSVSAQVDPNLGRRLEESPLVVDSQSVALFDQIPDYYIDRAKNIKMIFGNRSVGVNTNESLSCLEAESDEICWATRPTCSGSCVQLNHSESQYNLPQDSVDWYRPGGYDRTSWVHEPFHGTWIEMTQNYLTLLDNNQVQGGRSIADFDVFTFQFSYLNVTDTDSIANSTTNGFFADQTADKKDVYDLERRLVGWDDKFFIYQTSSLSRGLGNSVATNFNNQMRQFINQKDARGRYRIFLDFADIESHLADGTPCYDNRDGVAYCQNASNCENYPNDSFNYPAICQHYTVEVDNGHFSMGPIKIRMAKAYWVLMAQLAGWEPGGSVPTNTPVATASPTSSMTPSIPGDANNDSRVDGLDYVVWLTNYGTQSNQGRSVGDFNTDLTIDGLDYVVWLTNYTQ